MTVRSNIQKGYYWIYILRCNDNSLYTGIAKDIVKRYLQHINRRAKCKFTRRRDKHPLKLAQCWKIKGSRGDATKVELFIKKRSKEVKEELIRQPEKLQGLFFLKTNDHIEILPYEVNEILRKL